MTILDNRPTTSWSTSKLYAVGAVLFAALVALVAVIFSVLLSDSGRAYQLAYTGHEQCLHDTVFDPARGAMLHKDTVDGVQVLIVIPKKANSYKPSVLVFSVEQDLFSASLAPSDDATEAALATWCAR